ncbi:MAG: hypothetical protein GX616_09260 [Planctomycetes bacterium]|nr:hypothetical protein [Planctomycetota bacterium]
MKRIVALGAVLLGASTGLSTASVQESRPAEGPIHETFAIETYARRTYNYLDNMVDKDGLPYFNVFWTDPAEAAHDWPDFGDVTSRQLQAAVMARHMTGQEARNERLWYKRLLSSLDPKTGLLVRPKTSFCEPVADIGDQSLTLYALVTAYADTKDPALRDAICRMVDHLPSLHQPNHWLCGFMIKSLMTCVRQLDYKPALDQAQRLVRTVFDESPLFTPDNTFRHGGHMHGNLRTLVGAADYALYAKDPVIFSRVDAIYRYVRSEGTRFGFLPEVIGRKGDVVSCETCALMDFLGLAVTLANNGHPEYWGDVERMARNQLVESQVLDTSWLTPGDKPDTGQFTWRGVGARMRGGYAGWTSPTHILAAREELHWGGPELRGKTRAFQNCCGGSGTHAFFIVWKNCARFENGTLSVHLHIDKLLPQAEIRCYQPYQGLLTVDLRESCKVRVRIPEFVVPQNIKATSGGGEVKAVISGNYLDLGARQAGERLVVTYPMREWVEEVSIGNPGFRQYRYRVTWKGDTVVRMTPIGESVKTGFSDFDGRQVPVFYGTDGPGSLYQREYMLEETQPKPARLHADDGSLDFWFLR